jgi:hypothetical protein
MLLSKVYIRYTCGSGMFIPVPGSDLFPSRILDLHPGSRIRIKEFKYFNPKKNQQKWFLSSRKYDPVVHPGSRIPDPDADFLPILDPGSRDQKGTGSRIRFRNTD